MQAGRHKSRPARVGTRLSVMVFSNRPPVCAKMQSSLRPPSSAEAAEPLLARLRAGGPALVALSGGVDSSLVASLAYEALGDRAWAVTLVGPAVSAFEVHRAERVARSIGIAHTLLRVDPLASAEYRANPFDRCFFCRSTEAEVLLTEGKARGVSQYLDGIHLDDLGEERPGLIAMDRAGFRHPLAEAGYAKADVRREAHRRQLPNWDEPSDACLASRVKHGMPINEELLRRIEQGEELVRAAGFRRVRVRVDGTRARVEVDPGEVARLQAPATASSITESLRALGFAAVEIDPRGYRGASTLGKAPG